MKLNTKNKKPLKQIVLGVLVSWLWDSNPRPADYKGYLNPHKVFIYNSLSVFAIASAIVIFLEKLLCVFLLKVS